MTERTPHRGKAISYRWECQFCEPSVLLAMYDSEGQVQIKIRDRFYHFYGALGRVHATCPRCGTVHELDLEKTGRSTVLSKQPAKG
ncbi:MAG: hypothetical protein M9890_04360 [Thermomicrobiales bacterium]|nr:hypothetical protein [Thermomicrobiales bacterium]